MKKILVFLSVFLFMSMKFAYSADMRFVQVDNLFYTPTNEKSVNDFNKLIESINKQKDVEFVVFSGNNIAKAKSSYLESFIKKAKNLDMPFYVVIGNKEVSKQKNFGKEEYVKLLSKKVRTHKRIKSPNYVFEKNKVVFIVLDGSKDVIPSSMGYYRGDVLSWLSKQLKMYENRKVVILQHFPIIPPAQKEHMYTYKADEYFKTIADSDNIEAIISGHFGVNKELNYNGVLHISTSSAPHYRIIDIIDYDSETPTFWSVIKE